MGYYKLTDYPNLGGTGGGTLIIAQANLLQILNLGHETDPAELDAYYQENDVYHAEKRLKWWSLNKYDSTISIKQLSTGWPETNNCIVRFHCLSQTEPTYMVDGVQTPNFIDHYCVMVDWESRTIIDSYDGELKSGEPYGIPLGYAEYTATELLQPNVESPEHRYIWQPGDTMVMVAKRLGFTPEELEDHNGKKRHEFQIGDTLHLPEARKTEPTVKRIRYQPLLDRKVMHVQSIGGATKWSFGSADTWEDLQKIGFYPYGTNITIVGIAYVPLLDEDGNETEAAYYMDATAFGDYEKTGQIRYTVGFAWSDLVAGKMEPQKEVAVLEVVAESEPVSMPMHEYTYQECKTVQQVISTLPDDALVDDKGSYVWVKEFKTGKTAKLRHNKEYTIVGTFNGDGVLCARPKLAEEKGLWWGLPWDYLNDEAAVLDPEVPLIDRVQSNGRLGKKLTIYERLVIVPLSRAAHSKPLVKVRTNTHKE